MRIATLDLLAFGPFTNRRLDFSRAGAGGYQPGGHPAGEMSRPGVQLVFGPNEAGKSSALRALRDVLFGIQERSPDNFVHDFKELRIGVELIAADGSRLRFLRRKGRVNTLLDPDTHKPIDEAPLRHLLGRIDRATYESMFGINYDSLVQGGRQIAQLDGDIGKSLFVAAGGIGGLREVQATLEQELREIFLPAGAKPRLNAALAAFKQARHRLKEIKIQPKEFADVRSATERAERELAELERELTRLREELEWHQRCRDALPLLARRDPLRQQLNQLGNVRELRGNFPDEFRAAQKELIRDQANLEAWQPQREKLLEERHLLIPPGEWLAQREPIRQLQVELGSHRKAQDDLPRLRELYAARRHEAQRLLAELDPKLTLGDVDRLRLTKKQEIALQNLGKQYEQLQTRESEGKRRRAEIAHTLLEAEAELNSLPEPIDFLELQQQLKTLQEIAATEKNWLTVVRQARRLAEELDVAIARLGFWSGSPEQLERLPWPALETILVHEQRWAKVQAAWEQRTLALAAVERSLAETHAQIEMLQTAAGSVVTEDDLRVAREQRDQVWRYVRELLETGKVEIEPRQTVFLDHRDAVRDLVVAFEQHVQRSDAAADRLRHESQRANEYLRLVGERLRWTTLRDQEARAATAAREELERSAATWHAVWQPLGISPASPQEMRDWRKQLQHLIEHRIPEFREAQQQVAELTARTEADRLRLNALLQACELPTLEQEVSLEAGLRLASERVEEYSLRARNRQQAADQIARLRRELDREQQLLAEAEQALQTWRGKWREQVQLLGLTEETTPDQVVEVLARMRSLFEILHQAEGPDGFGERIKAIEHDARHFRHRIEELCRQCDFEYRESDLAGTVTRLTQKLNEAERIEKRMGELEQEIKESERRLTEFQQRLGEQTARLSALCQEAGCPEPGQLEQYWQRSEEFHQLKVHLGDAESGLLQLARSMPLEAFEEKVRGCSPEALEGEINRLGREREQAEERHRELLQEVGGWRAKLQTFDTGAAAVEVSAEAEKYLTQIEDEAAVYTRTKLAAIILRQAIEQFNDRNQEPILRRASEYFARLTGGAFAGLKVDYNEQDRPVLVGVRADTPSRVPIEGLSEGTADQLYFALRLGYLADWMERHEPLPLVCDDILIKFDDERALATLAVLADLSHRTQVILFTHHRHLVELAQDRFPDGMVHVNEDLGTGT